MTFRSLHEIRRDVDIRKIFIGSTLFSLGLGFFVGTLKVGGYWPIWGVAGLALCVALVYDVHIRALRLRIGK